GQGRGALWNEPDCPLAFSLDGKMVTSAILTPRALAGDFRRTFRLWDVATGTEIRSFQADRSSFEAAAFSPDGKLLAVGASSPEFRQHHYVYLWDVESGKELPPIEKTQAESAEAVSFLAFSPDGRTLASSGGGGILQLWEVATRREICRFQTPEAGLKSLAFSPDGRLLA